MDTATCHAYAEELMRRLRLKTPPLAIRVLRAGEQVPQGFTRPVRDMGCHLSLCQAFQVSRRDGTPMALMREDMWCPEPIIGFGLQQPPDFFLQGNNRYPRDVATPQAGRVYAEELPKLPTGVYSGVLSAPLDATPIEPEVITIYCLPAQLSTLLLALEYKDGHNLDCNLSSHAACIYGIVPVLVNRRAQIAIPCRGDRLSAMAEDDEMLVSVTPDELAELIAALRYLETTGTVYPKGYRMRSEYTLPAAYKTMAEIMGYLK